MGASAGAKGRLLRLALFCVLGMGMAMAMAGCSAGQRGVAEPTATPITVPAVGEEPTLEPYKFTDANGVPFPVPTTDANPIRSEGREAAWGSGVEVKRMPALLDAEHLLMLKGVAVDGRFVAGVRVPLAPMSPEPAAVVLVDVD